MSRRVLVVESFVILSLGGLVALAIYRSHLVDAAYGRYAGCGDCLETSVWANDAYLAAAFLGLLAIARLTRSRLLRAVFAGLATGGILAYCADLAIFRLLTHRLLATDVAHYVPDSATLASVVHPLLARPEGWLLVAGFVLTSAGASVAIYYGRAGLRPAAAWGAVSSSFLAFASWAPQAQYLHQTAFQNFLQVNLAVDPSRPYTEAAWNATRSLPPLPVQCEAGLAQRPSVIVLVVESLSAYHSALFSGLHDYTPRLDRIAREGTYFTNFHANGYSTEGGLIALLTGHVPIPTAGRFGSTMAFTDVDGDFNRWLRTQGYTTAFFTSGTLDFGDRGRWLPAIGVQHAEGGEHPFYNGMPRGVFNAAEDGALIDRFLQWHATTGARGPFVATVLTVETHPPFVSSRGEMDEPEKFREADREIARFVEALKARDYFSRGILLIVGDHRAMTPISEAERLRMGELAPMRVLALALGRTGLPRGESSLAAQQTDLIPSLRHVIGERSCRNEWQGRFLGADPQAARFVVHADPMLRNELAVLEAGSVYRLLLDGDDTRWLSSPPIAQEADRVRNEVNRQRIARMVEFNPGRPAASASH